MLIRIQMNLVAAAIWCAIYLPLLGTSEETGWRPLPRAMVERRHYENIKNNVENVKTFNHQFRGASTRYQYDGGLASDAPQTVVHDGKAYQVTSGYKYSYTSSHGDDNYYKAPTPLNGNENNGNGFSYGNPNNQIGNSGLSKPIPEIANEFNAKSYFNDEYNSKPNNDNHGYEVKPRDNHDYNGGKPSDGHGYDVKPNDEYGFDAKPNDGRGYEEKPNVGHEHVTKLRPNNGYEEKPNNNYDQKPNIYNSKPNHQNAYQVKLTTNNGYHDKPIYETKLNPTQPSSEFAKPNLPNDYNARPNVYIANAVVSTTPEPPFYGDVRPDDSQNANMDANNKPNYESVYEESSNEGLRVGNHISMPSSGVMQKPNIIVNDNYIDLQVEQNDDKGGSNLPTVPIVNPSPLEYIKLPEPPMLPSPPKIGIPGPHTIRLNGHSQPPIRLNEPAPPALSQPELPALPLQPLPAMPRPPPPPHQEHHTAYMHLFEGPLNMPNINEELPIKEMNFQRHPPTKQSPDLESNQQSNFQQHMRQNINNFDNDPVFRNIMKVVYNTLFYGDMEHKMNANLI